VEQKSKGHVAIDLNTEKIHTRCYTGAKGVQIVGDVGGDPSAPTVVLVHGGGQTRHSWGGAMHKLVASGHHVVNVDARGHGDSDWAPDGDYTIETLAQDLAGVIGELPAKPAVVGASMGGAAALYLVGALQPSLASALILVDIVPMIDPAGAAKIMDFMNGHADGFATLEEAADAVAAYNQALAANPTEKHSLYGRGLAYLRQGDHAKGQADIAAAVKLDANIPDEFHAMGVQP